MSEFSNNIQILLEIIKKEAEMPELFEDTEEIYAAYANSQKKRLSTPQTQKKNAKQSPQNKIDVKTKKKVVEMIQIKPTAENRAARTPSRKSIVEKVVKKDIQRKVSQPEMTIKVKRTSFDENLPVKPLKIKPNIEAERSTITEKIAVKPSSSKPSIEVKRKPMTENLVVAPSKSKSDVEVKGAPNSVDLRVKRSKSKSIIEAIVKKDIQKKPSIEIEVKKTNSKLYSNITSRFMNWESEKVSKAVSKPSIVPVKKSTMDIPKKIHKLGEIPKYLIACRGKEVEKKNRDKKNLPNKGKFSGRATSAKEANVSTKKMLKGGRKRVRKPI